MLKFKTHSFLQTHEKALKPMENDGFCIAKNIKTVTPSEGFQWTMEEFDNLNSSTFHFP